MGTQCLGMRCDVSSVESVKQMFAQTIQRFGTLDVASLRIGITLG